MNLQLQKVVKRLAGLNKQVEVTSLRAQRSITTFLLLRIWKDTVTQWYPIFAYQSLVVYAKDNASLVWYYVDVPNIYLCVLLQTSKVLTHHIKTQHSSLFKSNYITFNKNILVQKDKITRVLGISPFLQLSTIHGLDISKITWSIVYGASTAATSERRSLHHRLLTCGFPEISTGR